MHAIVKKHFLEKHEGSHLWTPSNYTFLKLDQIVLINMAIEMGLYWAVSEKNRTKVFQQEEMWSNVFSPAVEMNKYVY